MMVSARGRGKGGRASSRALILFISHTVRSTPFIFLKIYDGFPTLLGWIYRLGQFFLLLTYSLTYPTQPLAHTTHTARSAPFIFRKIYDGSPTILGGTCHLGQLVIEGYEQEAANGQALGHAYIGYGPLKLFASNKLGALKAEMVYLRSDDDPSYRTEMSGEALLRGMFDARGEEVTLQWHTGDFALDEIAPNHYVCPALNSVEADASHSREWSEYNNSEWVQDLDKRLEKELPGYRYEHLLDCLGTTVCTDRPFPPTLTEETLQDAFVHAAWSRSFKFVWNEAYYSKLGMGPFALELLENMRGRAGGRDGGRTGLKFGLFLGHDTSVLPLLAAWEVWDGEWPPYAAVLVIELYEADANAEAAVEGEGGREEGGEGGEKEHFFRLLYRGKELVMEGCEGEALCPFSVFEAATEKWALATDDPQRPCKEVYEFGEGGGEGGDTAGPSRTVSSGKKKGAKKGEAEDRHARTVTPKAPSVASAFSASSAVLSSMPRVRATAGTAGAGAKIEKEEEEKKEEPDVPMDIVPTQASSNHTKRNSSSGGSSSSSSGTDEKKAEPAAEEGGGAGGAGGKTNVSMLVAVIFSLLVGMLFGVIMTLSWAERRRRERGEDPALHNIGEGGGIGVIDRMRNRLMGYTAV
jgi:hypothetical protein